MDFTDLEKLVFAASDLLPVVEDLAKASEEIIKQNEALKAIVDLENSKDLVEDIRINSLASRAMIYALATDPQTLNDILYAASQAGDIDVVKHFTNLQEQMKG